MPTYCAPPPGNMKTTSGAASASWSKTRRAGRSSSRRAASSRSAATRTRRFSKARRPCLRVKATSARSCSGWARRCAASAAEASSSALRERADSTIGWNGQSEGSDAACAGASSSTAWTLVPPTPSEFTPARRGAAPRGQGVSASATRKGLVSKSMAGLGAS